MPCFAAHAANEDFSAEQWAQRIARFPAPFSPVRYLSTVSAIVQVVNTLPTTVLLVVLVPFISHRATAPEVSRQRMSLHPRSNFLRLGSAEGIDIGSDAG